MARRITLFAMCALVGLSSCDSGAQVRNATSTVPAVNGERIDQQPKSTKMKVKVGSKTFSATLDDNPAAAKLKALLPLTVEMRELNGNEKFYELPKPLPTDAANPKTIRTGDLMLWQSDTLVLFYKTFPTSYSYTRLGRIDDPSELADAVGSGGVTVTFESE